MILIGISSGIAAFKINALIARLRQKNYAIQVVMTEHAINMVDVQQIEKSSGNPVVSTLFPPHFNYRQILRQRKVQHIQLADSASVFVIAPATANIIGKIAHGIADDMLTTVTIATRAPVIVCPSMNTHMWENPRVQENLTMLMKRGYTILHPDSGDLACGYRGVGRLVSISEIENTIGAVLHKKQILRGKRILVTSGGTMEMIDPVRVITNRSSGKMGKAIAEVCKDFGAEVILIRAKSAVASLKVKEEIFESANDLTSIMKAYSSHIDILIHTAAVSDFKPREISSRKIISSRPLRLRLTPTPKILNMVKSWNPHVLLIGFKAVYKETDDAIVSIGMKKLDESRSDFIVVNDVGRKGIGFGEDENEIYIVTKKGLHVKLARASKQSIAEKLMVEVAKQILPKE